MFLIILLLMIDTFLKENIPSMKLVKPEGTYLAWIDVKEFMEQYNLTAKQVDDFIVHKATLWLDTGIMFGESGIGFERINIACPRATLQKALESLKYAIDTYLI